MRERNRNRNRKSFNQHLLTTQQNEITEYSVYTQLSNLTKSPQDKQVLRTIAEEEKKHAGFWETQTGKKVTPRKLIVFFYVLIARILGLTFAVKLMEKGEELAQINYKEIAKEIPFAQTIEKQEEEHEKKLLGLLNEEKLKYVGSMVLGVNDALVELTGALAGLTFALQNTKLIALTGLITGIAASLSMAGSEYLSTKAEGHDKNPIKAAVYTGIMYVITVFLLILPFYVFANVFMALGATLVTAIIIIFFFTFYISVAQDLPFKKRFLEMVTISLGVSAITFVIGLIIRQFLGIEV